MVGLGNGGGDAAPEKQTPSLPHSSHDIASRDNEAGGELQPSGGLFRVKSAGESGRRGLHPLHFIKIIWASSSTISRAVNVLWPFVPAALAVYYTGTGSASLRFSLAYIAMVPCANLIGFAGAELARKMPHTLGVLTETTIGSIVEIILFLVLLLSTEELNRFYIIRAAILGSILATMLLCLGLCFFAAGLKRKTATFDAAVSEVGTGLLLMAGFGLAIPTIFQRSINAADFSITPDDLDSRTTQLSRIVAVLLLISYIVFVFFQTQTHDGIYDTIFEHDEKRDADGHKDRAKAKLTLTECVVSLAVSITLVTLIALALVRQIEPVVEESGISDPFMGLILVPLVEKAAEHLTALDEAWDNQINFALSHCIGSTIQTAMLNAPLVVIVAWGRGLPLDLSFEIFEIAILILAIITVGNYLRDQKSDYLEGFLCVITYIAIAAAAFYFPTPPEAHGAVAGGESGGHTTEHSLFT
ncbi:putative Ca2+:H+ antiporter [Rosellinia necatrix]|uniref:Putative Ca2+:H+ antiporter n=1 Tax=Rosellinia necatrix TaxID=77044 RepID=A0A1W2TX33_ROSNE|nr:putative Ca2+:H+ antiporter [Rosellinia necatrix]